MLWRHHHLGQAMKYENPLDLFGERVIELRKVLGWSQEKLALESGLARSYVGGIERGQRNVSLVNICVIADALGVHPSEMLKFGPKPKGKRKPATASGT